MKKIIVASTFAVIIILASFVSVVNVQATRFGDLTKTKPIPLNKDISKLKSYITKFQSLKNNFEGSWFPGLIFLFIILLIKFTSLSLAGNSILDPTLEFGPGFFVDTLIMFLTRFILWLSHLYSL